MPNKVSGIILLISLGLGLTTKRAYVIEEHVHKGNIIKGTAEKSEKDNSSAKMDV